MNPQPDSDVLALRLAERAMTYLAADPHRYVPLFVDAIRELRLSNGPKAPYDAMERAAQEHWTALRDLLLSRGAEGDLLRSMAPLYAILPEADRVELIRTLPRPGDY